jgi:hypothetical protein
MYIICLYLIMGLSAPSPLYGFGFGNSSKSCEREHILSHNTCLLVQGLGLETLGLGLGIQTHNTYINTIKGSNHD